MSQKRMFDKSIVKCDDFLEMPDSSQNLYFHLSMEADDDGFVDNWRSIMRMTGKKEDDMKLLIAKQFLIPFESGVIVIKHWRINNYLRKDRYNPTKHTYEKSQLFIEANQEYSLVSNSGIPVVDTEKNRIEENSIVKNNITTTTNNINTVSINNSSINNNSITIYETIEKNFNRELAPMEIMKIDEWLSFYSDDIIEYAVEKAVMQNKKTFNYVIGILNNWKSAGYKTLKDIKQNCEEIKNTTTDSFNNSSKLEKTGVPTWFGKEIEADEATPEEIAELERQIELIRNG